MFKTDSVLRESLRLGGVSTHGITKVIVAREGVTLPSGEHLPYRATVGIASYGPHHDENVYPKPDKFDPFRFSPSAESSKDDPNGKGEAAPKLFVTTGDYYMGFSHGRNTWYVYTRFLFAGLTNLPRDIAQDDSLPRNS